MKVSNLNLSNFRCFSTLKVDLDENLTVFVAGNGGGKTTVLDSIATAFSNVVAMALDDLRERLPVWATRDLSVLSPNSVSYYRDFRSSEKSRPVKIQLELAGNDQKLGVSIYHRQSGDPDERCSIAGEASEAVFIKSILSEENLSSYPVFAYYQSTRYLEQIQESSFSTQQDHLDCWATSIDAIADFGATVGWIRALEELELRIGRDKNNFEFRLPALDAVRKAASVVLDSVSSFFFSTSSDPKLMVKQKSVDGSEVERMVSQLGAGHRNMFALVVDFARRLAQSNPDMENPLEADAILMIDEIDLHLHPAWQQRVLGDLRAAFPNTQIITSTHSPQVLTSVESKCIRILEDGKVKSAPAGLDGAESMRALETVFGTPSRPPGKRTDQINQLARLISEEKFDEAEALLKKLKKWSKGEEPYLIEAEDEIENRKWIAEAS